MSAIGDADYKNDEADGGFTAIRSGLVSDRCASNCRSGFRHRGLAVLGARAVVGEHVDHDEVGDRGLPPSRRGVPMPEAGRARLEAWPNTAFFGSAVHTGAES